MLPFAQLLSCPELCMIGDGVGVLKMAKAAIGVASSNKQKSSMMDDLNLSQVPDAIIMCVA